LKASSPEAIWRRIEKGGMYPAPIRPWRPYRWDRSVVQAERMALQET
jgi:hypothetical protein